MIQRILLLSLNQVLSSHEQAILILIVLCRFFINKVQVLLIRLAISMCAPSWIL